MLTHTREFEQPGKELELELAVHARLGGRSVLSERPLGVATRRTTRTSRARDTLPFQLDYMRPLPSGRLEPGVKLQRREIPVEYDVNRGEDSVIYPGLGDWSDWGEDIYAGYVN